MLIRVEGLRVVYPGGVEALSGAGMEARQGELVALTGPNGGGKTTLLRILGGLIPSMYPARVEGLVDVEGHDPRMGVDPRRAVYMQPDPALQVVGVTVLHEAALCPSMMGVGVEEARRASMEAVESVGLAGMEREPTPLLSSGQLQRTALAGVLSCRPRYLLLDEPTGHLDPEAGEIVVNLLQALAGRGSGVVVATHDERLVDAASRVYTVDRTIREGEWRHPPVRVEGPPRRPGEVLLEAEDLAVGYPGGPPIVRLRKISVRAGEMVALVGPNGGGKTTLLRALAGFLKPSRGTLRARARRAYLPANPLLVFSRPTLGRELAGGSPPLPVEQLMDRPLMELSSGQLQLAALAVVASSGARILLLDEPTHSLDPVNRGVVIGALERLAGAGYAIVAATHDMDLARRADTVVRVEGGVAGR